METLNVGCGATTIGDVNIDLFPNRREQCVTPWNPKNIENFVLADAENLPFQTNIFKKIYAIHILEHLNNPLKALREWKRVGKVITIKVPSAYDIDQTRSHFYTWNPSTLRNLLETIFKNVQISYTSGRIKFHGKLTKHLPLLQLITNRFPREIEAVCWN